ncbi:MAG: UPF0175 family protein [Verrucomicrobiae bacterium]|nr:UPF0175 family protein [Verrucomicrobiae bacterium]
MQIVMEIPDKVALAERMNPTELVRELKEMAAVKLFELGRLSSGRAAELAGMSRVAFLLTLARYNVFPMMAELDELEAKQHGSD